MRKIKSLQKVSFFLLQRITFYHSIPPLLLNCLLRRNLQYHILLSTITSIQVTFINIIIGSS